MEERTLRIGDEDLRITRFRGLKAIIASALVSRVMREVPDLQERVRAFGEKYRKDNVLEITPGMAKLPQFADLGFELADFEAAGGTLIIPRDPTVQETVIAIAPDLLELARKEVMRFLALIAIPNSELERADDADEVEMALDREGKRLFRLGYIDELLELGIVGWEVLHDQILSRQERLGKLKNLPFLRGLLSTAESRAEETLEEQEESTPQTSPEEVPSSSTDSPKPTDGTDEQLSMASPGTS